MQFFTNEKTISNVKRQVYLLGKSSYVAVTSGSGYLRPLTEEQASVNNMQYGLGFSLIIETSLDIREGDVVTIASTDYTVRGVVNHDRGGVTAYKKCLLLKGQAL